MVQDETESQPPQPAPPPPVIVKVASEYEGEWKHGICGCFNNCGLCLYAYFCPCIVAGQNAAAMGESCVAYGCLFLVPVCNIIFNTTLRGKIREKYRIPGTTYNDCCIFTWCTLCSVIQSAQQLKVDTIAPMDEKMPRD
ncbi:uncharacterized protein [Ptychodera flava]|uniref:uncharacterized protein n=1 Tax=Ptychodera flava TaxID=63121 RepID=UPI003969FAD9